MRGHLLVIMTVIASITDSSVGSPHHHDDPYRQARRLLKESRKAERLQQQQQDYYLNQGSGQVLQQARPSSSSSSGSGSPPNPILTPGNGGNFGTVGSALPSGVGGSNFQLPNLPGGQLGNLPTLPPYPIEQVNRGVSTILNGVRSFDLGQILRGAFVFPRNENVRSVANNVIDSIFGAQRTTPNGGNNNRF